jgi:hypothetical protein
MNQKTQWRNPYDVNSLEALLEKTLVPVQPRQTFISNLHQKLTNPEARKSSPSPLQLFLLGAAGVATSVLLVVTGIRATVTLLGALGVLRQMKEQVNPNEVTPLSSPS